VALSFFFYEGIKLYKTSHSKIQECKANSYISFFHHWGRGGGGVKVGGEGDWFVVPLVNLLSLSSSELTNSGLASLV